MRLRRGLLLRGSRPSCLKILILVWFDREIPCVLYCLMCVIFVLNDSAKLS